MNNQIILFDFEYTAWEGSKARKWSEPWEHREIIQIAAVQVTFDEGIPETNCFDCLVRPTYNPVLSSYITALTGIEQSAVDASGKHFPEAFTAFYSFCGQGQVPLYCYGDDVTVLIENCALHEIELAPFQAGIFDISVIIEQAGIDTRLYTSGTVHQAVGTEFYQTAHNALNDVRSLAFTIRRLISLGKIGTEWLSGESNSRGQFLIT